MPLRVGHSRASHSKLPNRSERRPTTRLRKRADPADSGACLCPSLLECVLEELETVAAVDEPWLSCCFQKSYLWHSQKSITRSRHIFTGRPYFRIAGIPSLAACSELSPRRTDRNPVVQATEDAQQFLKLAEAAKTYP